MFLSPQGSQDNTAALDFRLVFDQLFIDLITVPEG